MSLRLNNVPKEIFKSKGPSNSRNITREDLVASGRLVACEYAGKACNCIHKNNEYTPMLKDDLTYAALTKGHKEKLLMFCAGKAYAAQGKDAPSEYSEVANDLSLAKNQTFLATLSGIVREVITPLLPYTIANAGGMLMETSTVPLGQTKEIVVHSNDIFLFEDSSWGANRSASEL